LLRWIVPQSSPRATQEECFLTSEEVLSRLVESQWLRARAATCLLPAVRVGSEWRFRLSDLEAWIAEQRSTDAAHTAF
jgi:hypothetical protein